MQTAYHAKYPLFVCVVLLSCIFHSAAQICGSNDTPAEFQNNVKMVLKNLVENTSSSNGSNGFNTSSYGRDPDRAYGLLQCRADTTVDECVSCSYEANTSMLNDCTNAKVATSVEKITNQPDELKAVVGELFSNLTEDALQSPIKYAVGSTNKFALNTINGLLQCWWDFTSVQDCDTCLKSAIRQLLDVTFGGDVTLQGGGSGCGSCFARYETYPNVQPLSPPPRKNSTSKIGMVVGIASGLFIMLLLCIFAIQRKFKLALLWKSLLLMKGNLDSELDSEIRPEREMIFSFQNIKAATRNFHEDIKLGERDFGSVYKGTMPNGMQIVVKRLSTQSSQGKKQFLNEVKLVAKIQHRNLVNLLGYCVEGPEHLLVYEFLPNKCLDKILFHFGLARLFDSEETHVSTMIAGTLGFMEQEYAMHRQLSVKADVYSFGVVTLEIICGRKNNDSRLSVEFQSLLEWVWRYYREGDITKIIDRSILNYVPMNK